MKNTLAVKPLTFWNKFLSVSFPARPCRVFSRDTEKKSGFKKSNGAGCFFPSVRPTQWQMNGCVTEQRWKTLHNNSTRRHGPLNSASVGGGDYQRVTMVNSNTVQLNAVLLRALMSHNDSAGNSGLTLPDKMCTHTPTFNTHTHSRFENTWPSQKEPPTRGQRLKMHTLSSEVNILYRKTFTTNPRTWSLPQPLSDSSVTPSDSIFLSLLCSVRQWGWLVKREEEKAVIRPFLDSELCERPSSFDTRAADERRRPARMLADISPSVFLHVSAWAQKVRHMSAAHLLQAIYTIIYDVETGVCVL